MFFFVFVFSLLGGGGSDNEECTIFGYTNPGIPTWGNAIRSSAYISQCKLSCMAFGQLELLVERVWGVEGSGFRVQGSGFRVYI